MIVSTFMTQVWEEKLQVFGTKLKLGGMQSGDRAPSYKKSSPPTERYPTGAIGGQSRLLQVNPTKTNKGLDAAVFATLVHI